MMMFYAVIVAYFFSYPHNLRAIFSVFSGTIKTKELRAPRKMQPN